jgi:PEP-CTERM motif
LAQSRYGFTNKGNSLQFYYDDGTLDMPEGYPDLPTYLSKAKINGQGTYENLVTALKDIGASASANPQKEVADLFFQGHGRIGEAATPRQNGMNGVPKDGAVVSGGPGGATTTFDLAIDPTFWQDLEVGIIPNDSRLVRFAPAEFGLDGSEDVLNEPIGVAIDGLPLGSFSLASSTTGAELDVNLPDSFTAELLSLAAGDPSIPVSFTLQNGDWFRIATEDDVLLDPSYQELQYGFGISVEVGPAVPEPATWALIGLGFVALGALTLARAQPSI